jgi:uncharacterized protein Yka (UPF0111/DUF47 family)
MNTIDYHKYDVISMIERSDKMTDRLLDVYKKYPKESEYLLRNLQEIKKEMEELEKEIDDISYELS